MKYYSIILLLYLLFTVSVAQSQSHHCATPEVLEKYLQQDPAFKLQQKKLENYLYHHLYTVQFQPRNDISVVPVVVHVVYDSSSQNITDAQIQTQIDILNQDFRRLNSDTANTPSDFKSIATDSKIIFCLAVRDPNGASTTGITRSSTSLQFFTQNDNVKSSSLGGQDPWPSGEYLNIWVCNLKDSLAGYATFPGTQSNLDGVVVDYQFFGNIGTAKAPYDLGRTTTHQVGHWLGLYHTYNINCEGESDTSCTTQGDFVCDTPPSTLPGNSCVSGQNTCTEFPVDHIDQQSNFMNWSTDSCLNLFTIQQAQRMRYVLYGPRLVLLNSYGCIPTTFIDASIEGILNLPAVTCDSIVAPSVIIANNSNINLTTVQINYRIDNGSLLQNFWSGNLLPKTRETVLLLPISISGSDHIFTIYTTNPNSLLDPYPYNDTISQGLYIASTGLALPLPYKQDFDSLKGLPDNLTIGNNDTLNTWQLTPVMYGSNSLPTRAMYMSHFNYSVVGEEDEIIIYMLDLTGVSGAYLAFDVAYARYSTFNQETMNILVSDNCGSSFDVVYSKIGSQLKTIAAPQTTEWFPSNTTHWRRECIDLSVYAGSKIYIRFQAVNGYGNNLFIDNIEVSTTKCSTGISDNNDPNNLSVIAIPNPSSNGIFKLIFYENFHESCTIDVFNILGTIVYSENFLFPGVMTKDMDLSKLPAGIYILKLSSVRELSTFKLIIQ